MMLRPLGFGRASLGHRGRAVIGPCHDRELRMPSRTVRRRPSARRSFGPMNIAVAIRLMPKTGDELEVDASGTDIDREFVELAINEFDDQALEEAVLIKEATGATVTAVGLRRTGSSRPCGSRTRAAPTGWSSSTPARSTRTTRARRRSRSPRRSASWPPTSCWSACRRRPTCSASRRRLAVELGWPQASVVVGVTVADGTARVSQEYAGGGSPCSASSCRRSSACSRRAHRRATCR